jgi:hypothetical protein
MEQPWNYTDGKTEGHTEKPVPALPLYPPQIPHGLSRARTHDISYMFLSISEGKHQARYYRRKTTTASFRIQRHKTYEVTLTSLNKLTNKRVIIRLNVLTAVTMKMVLFWVAVTHRPDDGGSPDL